MILPGLWHNTPVVLKRFSSLLLAFVLSASPLPSMAQANAQMPYAMVSSYHELFDSLANLDRIDPSIMILSTDPAVPPQAIAFKIKTGDGWKTFSPDENGVIEFPKQPDWNGLNLISDQPKGTLQLIIGFNARPLDGTRTTYQELMALVPQFEEALTALAEMQGQPPPGIKGLTVQMPEGSGASIHILSKKRKTTLRSTRAGLIIMKYNKSLWDENPPVEFDEIPVGIVPLQ